VGSGGGSKGTVNANASSINATTTNANAASTITTAATLAAAALTTAPIAAAALTAPSGATRVQHNGGGELERSEGWEERERRGRHSPALWRVALDQILAAHARGASAHAEEASLQRRELRGGDARRVTGRRGLATEEQFSRPLGERAARLALGVVCAASARVEHNDRAVGGGVRRDERRVAFGVSVLPPDLERVGVRP